MTSATGEFGQFRRGRGFTLLEVLIVLAVMILFVGFFGLYFEGSAEEEALARVTVDLKGAALKSKKRSFTFRRNQFIVFGQRAFWTTENPPTPDDPVPALGPDAERFSLPPGVEVRLLAPGSDRWADARGHVWTFRASGLSDPLQVRFTAGDSYSELDFNVLTALAEEETVIR